MEKHKQLYLMCGVPGAGKSHWIAQHKGSFSGTVTVISRDDIRFSIVKEGEEYFSHENEVFREFIRQIELALMTSDVVIADATHITSGSRRKTLNAINRRLKAECKIIAMVIKSDLKTTIAQNEMRSGRQYVPISVIRRMTIQFQMPELKEGFDEIWIYEGYKYTIIEEEVD